MLRIRATLLAVLVVVAPVAAPGAPGLAAGALASDNVELVANIPDVAAVGARIVDDLMYVTTGQGLRIYDVSGGIPLPIGALELPHLQNEDVDTDGEILLIAADHFFGRPELLYVVDVSDPRIPMLTGPPLQVEAAHTATCISGCSYAWLGGARGRIVVVDLKGPSAPRVVGTIPIEGTVHDVQVDAAGIAWVSTGAGLYGYTTSDPLRPVPIASDAGALENDFIIHNSLRPDAASWAPRTGALDDTVRPGELLLVTEEDWLAASNGGCAQDGVFQTARYTEAGGVARIEKLDTYNVGRTAVGIPTDRKPTAAVSCSSHYFDHRNDGVVAVAWYEQGTRFLDVSDPRRIRPVGYFVPAAGETITALWNGDHVYTFDTYRGIDVLRFTGSPNDAAADVPPVAPTRPQRAPDPRFGGACRIAV